jgi:hypothetical protein
MRHDQIHAKDSYTQVEVAAVWPAADGLTALAAERPTTTQQAEQAAPVKPAAAAPDIPVAVGAMIVGAYVALISAFAIATVRSPESVFAIVVAALFLAAYFTVPRLFFAVEPKGAPRPDFARFMEEGQQTATGPCSGGNALVQMLIVPLALTVGALAMGVAAAIYFLGLDWRRVTDLRPSFKRGRAAMRPGLHSASSAIVTMRTSSDRLPASILVMTLAR